MYVVATAGHVDHGKSTLVRALTGSDPDRLEEERRRGLSIELGYCWAEIGPAGDIAFVDVPGHERFLSTMLSGVGPVPAVLFVVAADDSWMPQAAEHLAALDALGVSHGVLAVTRADLADPSPALERASSELARTSLRGSPTVPVSGVTGEGLDRLRGLVSDMVTALPEPDPDADVRLWVDRSFHIRGAGTVVTGTLPAGRIGVGDTLCYGDSTVRVRAVQSLGRNVAAAQGVARVALNLSGSAAETVDRGGVLATTDAWTFTDLVDVRVRTGSADNLPERPLLHIGAGEVATRARPLTGDLVRLRLDRSLPLHIGDRALLRDPGSRTVWGVTVLDPVPGPLGRRGAARHRGGELANHPGVPDLEEEVRRRGTVRLSTLRRLGVRSPGQQQTREKTPGVGLLAGDWVLSADLAARLPRLLEELIRDHDSREPLNPGLPVAAAAQALGLPTAELVEGLVRPPLRLAGGRVGIQQSVALPPLLEKALTDLERDLTAQPFAAPTADRLRELGLDTKSVAAASKAGRLLRIGDGIVLLPSADDLAVSWLRELPQPFTTSEARVRLGTSRRVVLPLLAHLDRRGLTRRLPDDRRTVLH